MLWKRDFVLARPGTTFVVDYCQYGTAYKKPTMLWSNTPLQGFSVRTCPGPRKCAAIAPLTRRHIVSINGGEMGKAIAAIPDRLVLELFQAVHQDMPQQGKRIERIAERVATALTNPIVGVRSYRVELGSWPFKVAHADGSVAWRELADIPEDFDRLAWPSKVRARFAVDPAPFPYERLVNVALDGNSVLIEVKWSKCRETSWLQADAAAMREIATPV